MKTIRIGRSSRNNIVIMDATEQVSRFHAEITCHPDGQMTIKDISSNGTWLNGTRLEKGIEYKLKMGDHVTFAKLKTLNWDDVSGSLTARVATNFLRDLGKMFGEVTNYEEIKDSITVYFKILLKGPVAIWDQAFNISKGSKQALICNEYYLLRVEPV